MPKIRESNYDLLRICSTVAVVVLHVSGVFLRVDEMKVPTNCTLPVMMLNHIVRFAPPCFFMLSGSFILADERNTNYKHFYKKSLHNIGITAAVFCLLYVMYNLTVLMVNVFILHNYNAAVLAPRLFAVIKELLKGQPYYHLWYLFTLAGLYIAAPFVIRLASMGGGKPIRKIYNYISRIVQRKLYNK